MNAIAERSLATKTQKWAEQMATDGRAWRRCQGRGHLAEGVLAVSSARESWPKKIVTVRKTEQGNSLLVVDADERLAVVTVDEEGLETSYQHVSCFEDAVIDACPFMGSDTEAVIVTALGKAMLVDWQQNCLVKTFSTADDEAADDVESVRRGESVRLVVTCYLLCSRLGRSERIAMLLTRNMHHLYTFLQVSQMQWRRSTPGATGPSRKAVVVWLRPRRRSRQT
jgi:hypothetical protein